jgi:hypothetical protein
VILAVPQMEIVFFHDRDILTQWFGDRLTPEILIRAEFQPRQMLEHLLAEGERSPAELIEGLSDRQVEALRQTTVIQEAMGFLRSVQPMVDAA